jgi:hypothetical protein
MGDNRHIWATIIYAHYRAIVGTFACFIGGITRLSPKTYMRHDSFSA